jgi:hypothetical protein
MTSSVSVSKNCQGEPVEPGKLYITRLRQAQTDTIPEKEIFKLRYYRITNED